MQNNPETNRGIRPGVAVAILVVVGVLVGAIVFKKKPAASPETIVAEAQMPAVPATTPGVTPPRQPSPAVKPAVPSRPPDRAIVPPQIPNSIEVSPIAQPATGAATNWEQRIDGILGDDQTDEAKKADALLALFPTLPEDGQIEAIQHISNLLPDDRYSSLAPTLTNPLTKEPVLEVLLTDLLNRPDSLKLPTLLELARTPNHPKASDAIDVLEVFTEENYGTDWAKWEAAVQKYLKENPEQP